MTFDSKLVSTPGYCRVGNKEYIEAWAYLQLKAELENVSTQLSALRRSAQPLPQAGGWRLLEVGEVIEYGDEYLEETDGKWHGFLAATGNKVVKSDVIRRRLPAPDIDERIPMVNPNHPCYGVDLWMCREQDVELAKGQGYISFQEYAAQQAAPDDGRLQSWQDGLLKAVATEIFASAERRKSASAGLDVYIIKADLFSKLRAALAAPQESES